ncbi:MAG: Sporulation initiation phosphotransferase F [Verrucomicrobia bacterium ADurb.Bin345]|nr:MAG: Sporulation initiation phosphotransferase F [Verrucomicrobia bacterium ADurb.Bin345]
MNKNDLSQPTFITVPRAAMLCGVSRNTMFQWVRQGRLKAYQTPGRTNLIRPSDLVAFMRENGMYVPPDLATLGDQESKIEAQYAMADVPEGTLKALVVDDESAIRSIVTRTLKEVCPVYEAATGYEALHLLTMHADIRIVLLDLRMPGQHGLQTLKEIRTFRPDVQVAIVTGYDAEIPAEVRAYTPSVRIVKKPFDVNALRQMVQEMKAGLAAAP